MKIFRKIRFRTITKSGFSKYVLYAFGEILLVVIGILIALYINNKKDISDRIEIQKNHFKVLKEELQNNLEILEKEQETLGELIENIRDLINLSNSNTLEKEFNETYLSELLFLPITRAIEVNYENAAFAEFTSSSSLKNVKNDSLRSLLRAWNRKLETFKFQENVVHESLDKANNFIEVNGSLKTIFDNINLSESYLEIKNSKTVTSNKNLLKSRQFENILIQYLGVATQLHKKEYPSFKSDITNLIYLLEVVLNN
ncbi:hypothetical protein [Polaribacter porphyrae]|uniref:Uncharacterized protein n=1 Tax=Polaribacter porphyrae TaxID=1137780 RepID=A0A2S7WRB9_9FLAO|nr:hypothetical protein [Polaribacter porphyrae]PQJ80150.1 hypothetical protein BTO18_13620 [Polaribacter porphyrae]